jgi:hypothetical protein
MNGIKFIRIFLLILIIIGAGLLATQKLWVPKVVEKILLYQEPALVSVSADAKNQTGQTSFGWCMANGGKDLTPEYTALKKCVFEDRIYEEKCVGNKNYFVAVKAHTGSVGSDFLIKSKSSEDQIIPCEYVVESGDFEIKSENPDYVLALENNFLILDEGTGPGPRGLIVYDLSIRKKIYEDMYLEPVTFQNNSMNYWTGTTKKVTEENCPEFKELKANGLGAAIEARVSLDLSSLSKKETREFRCSPRQ